MSQNDKQPVILTKRTYMRKFHMDDAPFFFRLNNDWEVMKYTGEGGFENLEGAQDLVRNYDHYEKYGYGRWTVLLRDTHEPIGWCGLKNHPDEGYIDLGYRFERKYWGQGYGTETAQACVDYGFNSLGMTEIVGRVARENIGSIRVLEKVGMEFWKQAPCEGIDDSLFYKIRKP